MDQQPVIQPETLLRLFEAGEPNLILFDVRTGNGAKEAFLNERLRASRFADLEHDLSAPPENPAIGGRHPLPIFRDFVAFLERAGVTEDSIIIAYDDKNGANAASRLWWMCRSIGHRRVFVLDGGLAAAKNSGLPMESGPLKKVDKTEYACALSDWQLPLATLEEVKRTIAEDSGVVVDVRDAKRFSGLIEPIDRIAGHIPGAVNLPFSLNLDENGRFLSAQKLKELYEERLPQKPLGRVIIHCGSGVTACHSILAFEQAGLGTPALYVGSWSEWSNAGQPVAVTN